jgi:hypothetical protein
MAQTVTLTRDKLIEALRHLEVIVPSLDRLGSAASDLSDDEYRRAIVDFVHDWHVGPRLAKVRKVLSEAFDYDELERLFGGVDTWEVDHRKPRK